MKNIIVLILVLASLGCSIGSIAYVRNVEKQLQDLTLQVHNLSSRPTVAQHNYRFERSGASLWRYDETTGESCQVTSNRIDNWAGGNCALEDRIKQNEARH
jgi:hypothetical protein